MATEKVEYLEGEHETMLRQLDALHHETRGQTIARLEAALKVARALPGADVRPLVTRTEVVTREVTVPTAADLEAEKVAADAATPAEKTAKAKRKKTAKKAKAKAAEPAAKPE